MGTTPVAVSVIRLLRALGILEGEGKPRNSHTVGIHAPDLSRSLATALLTSGLTTLSAGIIAIAPEALRLRRRRRRRRRRRVSSSLPAPAAPAAPVAPAAPQLVAGGRRLRLVAETSGSPLAPASLPNPTPLLSSPTHFSPRPLLSLSRDLDLTACASSAPLPSPRDAVGIPIGCG